MKLIQLDPVNDRFEIIADSALTLPGRPTFIPEIPEAASWEAVPLLAVRVSRLGKTISAKFAHRYTDAFTLAARLMPLDSDGTPLAGIASIIDFGLTIGEWAPLPEIDSLEVTFGDGHCVLSDLSRAITEATVAVSSYATMKMGDILLLPLPVPATKAAPGLELTATANISPLLHLRLK